ncbi:MAG TPA: class I SAM-dependent methyltransferase [Chitinophagaceae bacterium]|nr:class I SAM-dependent methyltransferase [Chitinophagaceae bacterium]
MSLTASIKNLLKKLIASAGYEINVIGSRGLGYISAESVVLKANEKHLTVNQYLEELWGLDTHAAGIIKNFELEKYLQNGPLNIVEIGAGTGVYVDKLIKTLGRGNIGVYQVYETAADWVKYLGETYPIQLPESNGYQLKSTNADSVDLVHAHGVFVYTSFITSMSYLKEMIRVVKKGGIIAFDVFDQSSYTDEIIEKWISTGHTYPNIIPEEIILDLFSKNGFRLLKTFHSAFEPGKSKYFVYLKEH